MANIETAVAFMESIAADDSHGYSQLHRNGSPDYDCSSLVGTALNKAGFNVNLLSTTRTLYDQLIKCGFKTIGINEARKRGDIFLTPGKHVIMCVDSSFIVHASIDEVGGTRGDTSGDQTGKEICKRAFYYPSYGWTYHLRYSPTVSEKISVGIDVSAYQKNIDWNAVKSTGVNFVIVKIIRKDGNPDAEFENHYSGAKAAGLIVDDVYNYTYATTITKAIEDANKVVKILNGRKATVWMDIEDECMKNLGSYLMDIIDAYRSVIEGANLGFGVYSGLSFYNSYISPYLGKIRSFSCWLARYGKNDGQYHPELKPNVPNLWGFQYTSKGAVNGVGGFVDMNVKYINTPSISQAPIPTKETSILVVGQTTANLNVRQFPTTDSSILKTIKSGEFIQLIGDLDGWYKVQPQGYVSKDYIKQVRGKVTANKLNLRSTADSSVDSNKIDVLLKDEVVTICLVQGEWYHVLTSKGHTGWASGKYITLV